MKTNEELRRELKRERWIVKQLFRYKEHLEFINQYLQQENRKLEKQLQDLKQENRKLEKQLQDLKQDKDNDLPF